MQIQFVEVSNFRKLQSVRAELAEETTLFVGANNSGKTSAMLALRHFLVDGGRFSTHDFTLSHWQAINQIGKRWETIATDKEAPAASVDDWTDVLPTLDVWLHIENDEVHYVRAVLPTIRWEPGRIGIRLRFEPKDVEELYIQFTTMLAAATDTKAVAAAATGKEVTVNLWPLNMIEYLDRELRKHFTIKAYVLDPTKVEAPQGGVAQPQTLPATSVAVDGNPLSGLIRIHEINAQRGFGQASDSADAGAGARAGSAGHRESRRLSDQLRTYYAQHLDPFDKPNPADIQALAAIESAQREFDARLEECFELALNEVSTLGYPGVTDPRLKITTRLRPADGMNHESAVQYEVDMTPGEAGQIALRLPEDSNGLGYQNLVSMIFQLMSFRDAWMRVGKAGKDRTAANFELEPLHLVLIEEPEAHLHAQVQQVFIRKAYSILRAHVNLGDDKKLRTQLVVSTHSSHVAHETDFANLRYFRRLPAGAPGTVPISTVVNLSEVFGPGMATANFARRYLRAAHCDLFFADAAILVEGPAERMLVPHFIRNYYPELNQSYLTLLEIGGAHAHRLRPLVQHLGLPTLVITDLDSQTAAGAKTRPKRDEAQTTNNTTLRQWAPEVPDVDRLLDLVPARKIRAFDGHSAVRVAYQTPINITLTDTEEEALPYTFEDALVFSNIDIFKAMNGTGLVKKFRDALNEKTTVDDLAESFFKSLDTGKKAEFALDILALEDPEKFTVPLYIGEGLEWLQSQLQRRKLDIVRADPDAEGG
ncbi:MAG: AAA family ATPase [Pseudomonadota bacterium]|uniref:AAA family ATPase n=1 Tax=Phenylobacterium sp. TaxID=1871053 RepID=UPI0025E4F8D9|nr:AAA family ATPase [Phenylobacterium sp.]MBT9471818.1 AAA family ATPase [Phenylobacterium sp.]